LWICLEGKLKVTGQQRGAADTESRVEKRKFVRIPFNAKVSVKSKDATIEGQTENVSLRGMYLRNFAAVPLGEEVEVRISLPDAPADRILVTKAVAVRYQDGGTGFQFGAMDFDSFFTLQEIVARVSGAPGQVMTEVLSFVNNG
jgi:hypothetical protein